MGSNVGEIEIHALLDVEVTRLRQLNRHTGDTPDDVIGDCFRTVIACLLGYRRAADVPHFVEENIKLGLDGYGGWEDITAARRWLRDAEALDLALITREEADRLGVPGQATARSKTGPWNHSVVYQRGQVVWCPSTGDPDTDEAGDYTTEDLIDGEPVLVVCRPYEPGPDELLARWRAMDAVEEASHG